MQKPIIKSLKNLLHVIFNTHKALAYICDRYPVESFCYPGCNTGKGITVTTERYSISDHVFKVIPLKKSSYSLRYRLLAGRYEECL